MQVGDLIRALSLVGKSYRNKADTGPADPIVKIIGRLNGHESLSVIDWVEKQGNLQKRPTKTKKQSELDINERKVIASSLEHAESQHALTFHVNELNEKLSAEDWKALARQISGKTQGSGKASREWIETHFSDRLLMKERVRSVKEDA